MEVKVWVEGVERSISGVTFDTTCTDLIYALAHATGQKGKFVLVESFHNTERSLSPSDHPLQMLKKYGEKAEHVKYTLRKLDNNDVDMLSDNSSFSSSADSKSMPIFAAQRESSISSISSSILPFSASLRSEHMESIYDRSTSSLPAYSHASLPRRRPPPPDYTATMERKFAQLLRNEHNIAKSNCPVAEMKLNHNDLLKLIDRQEAILEQQRERLRLESNNASYENANELFQLEAQQRNLRRVLETLRQNDWGRQYEEETKKHRQTRAKILATQEKLKLIQESKAALARQEEEVRKQLEDAQRQAQLAPPSYCSSPQTITPAAQRILTTTPQYLEYALEDIPIPPLIRESEITKMHTAI